VIFNDEKGILFLKKLLEIKLDVNFKIDNCTSLWNPK